MTEHMDYGNSAVLVTGAWVVLIFLFLEMAR